MNTTRYSTAFVSSNLLRFESVLAAELYLKNSDWSLVRSEILSKNLFQTRMQNTAKRLCVEVLGRLHALNDAELQLLVNGTPREQGYLLWISLCRRYSLVGEFAVEVLREKFLARKHELTILDFDAFLNKKSQWNPELDSLKPETRTRVRQTIFKLLREAELLSSDNQINSALLSSEFIAAVSMQNRDDVFFVPSSDSYLGGISL